MGDYFLDIDDRYMDKVFVLIIYDITDNRRRRKLDKFLRGYGFRVQKSAFEAIITKKLYQKLLSAISSYATGEDSIRIYKLMGKGKVIAFGKNAMVPDAETIII